jgi:hypothetical protein
VVGTGEPQWSEADRGKALAWQSIKQATCVCGTRHDEWIGDRSAYIADEVFCPGCAAIALHQDNMPKDEDGHIRPGFKTVLKLRAWWEREQANRD